MQENYSFGLWDGERIVGTICSHILFKGNSVVFPYIKKSGSIAQIKVPIVFIPYGKTHIICLDIRKKSKQQRAAILSLNKGFAWPAA